MDSPAGLTADIQRSLFFKMPLGDESRLQMRIKAFPAFDIKWISERGAIDCIVKTGTFERLDQDHRISITLPAGHRQDQTTCNQRTLSARVTPSDIGEVDIQRQHTYGVAGQPGFMTSNQPLGPAAPTAHPQINFPIDIAGIRALNAERRSTITITSPGGVRTATLRLDVRPSALANGFTQVANCRNPQTGNLVNVNDVVECELRLAAPPPAAGQLITFEALDRLCVGAGNPDVGYANATGIGTTTLRGAATIFQVPLRALGANTSAGTPCASETGVQHTVKFWIGPRDTETGADFTQAAFRIRRLP